MILPTTKDSHHLIRHHKSHDEVNTYAHLIRHLTTDKDARKLTILLIINLICAVLEIIYGLISNSIGLLSDSAHMLFDSTALAVGIYASYKATLPANSKFSYGFDRFQTLSGLINGIFLIFIGFYIFIESLERIYNPPVIHSSKMIVVAVIGLIVNVVGVTFFHEHAHFGEEHDHGHGCSHGHSHKKEEKSHKHSHKEHAKAIGGHSHTHGPNCNHSHSHHHHDHSESAAGSSNSIPSTLNSIKEDEHHHSHSHSHAGCNHGHNSQQPDHHHQHHCNHEEKSQGNSHSHSHSHEHKHEHKHDHKHDHKHGECSHSHEHEHEHEHEEHDHDHDHDHGHDHHHNENLYGVFLHILADLLGSVGVITSSILIMLFDWYIADAICSAITSLLILASVVPLIKSSIMVFLQTYPVKYKKSFHQALSEISHHPQVVEFRDAHLWMYTHSKLVCSVILVVKQGTVDTNHIVEFARKKLKTIKKIEYMTIDTRVEGQI